MPDLLNELRRCPAPSFPMLVPLQRRTEPAPSDLASLFAPGVGPSINATLLEVFGEAADAADCALRLRAALERARALTQSSAATECACGGRHSRGRRRSAAGQQPKSPRVNLRRDAILHLIRCSAELAITTDERL